MIDTTKIIKGVVSSGQYTKTDSIVKEDYGLYLQIEGIELPETYQVDFSNDEHRGNSVTMIGNSNGVRIPRQFIDSGRDIFAFLYHVGEDFGRTVYKFIIPNKIRPDRTNEQPTPEEQSVIDQTISALNEAVAQTAQDKTDADASAQSAKEDADRAEQARDEAQGYADTAYDNAVASANSAGMSQTYANNASASASASANSASQSAQIKADVEDLVDDAQASANASEQYAGASANSATQASLSASEARAFMQTASTKAQEASQKADSITSLTAQANTLPDGSSATASYNPETGVMSFGIPKGATGDSPTITASKTGDITYIYADGAEIAQIEDGTNGDDGYSPTANVSKSGKVATITITDKDGTTSAQVEDGTDGTDGVSPTVTITPITGGHRITITDADGTETADVMDGHNGMVTVNVSGTTPTITAQADYRYVCGEVATLDLTPPASGICDVVFESGATATVLTITGTVKWANGFDPTSLEANTTYELNIMDGLGVACAWT